MTSFYKVYGMQGILQTYARRLDGTILKEGKSSYQQKVPVLYYIPSTNTWHTHCDDHNLSSV